MEEFDMSIERVETRRRFLSFGLACVPTYVSAQSNQTNRTQQEFAYVLQKFDGSELFFAGVNLQSIRLEPRRFQLGNGRTINSARINREFGLRRIPAGDYAMTLRLISVSREYTLGGAGVISSYPTQCYETSSPVLRFAPNRVHVLDDVDAMLQRFKDAKPPEAGLLDRARDALLSTPAAGLPIAHAERVGQVRFSKSRSLNIIRPVCGGGTSIEIITDPIPAG
jgi:hypothetical protein